MASVIKSNSVSAVIRRKDQLRYHADPCFDELSSYCSTSSNSSAVQAGTISSKSFDLIRSLYTGMNRATSTFSECFGGTLDVPDDREKQLSDAKQHEETRSELKPNADDGRLHSIDQRPTAPQAQNTRLHYYSGPRTYNSFQEPRTIAKR